MTDTGTTAVCLIQAARNEKEQATSDLYAAIEAEERAWRALNRSFFIATSILVGMIAAVLFA